MRHDRTGDQSDRFENDGFRVRHASPVLQADEPVRSLDTVDFHLRRFLYVRPGDQVSQNLDEKIADRRVTSDYVFQREQRHVPGYLWLGAGLDVIDQAVYVILFGCDRLPAVQAISDNIFLHKLPDLVAPIGHPCHISLVQRHQERHKVRGVTLIHLVKHFIEILDHRAERTVVETEASWAKILDKDVRTCLQDQRLDMQADAGGADQVIDQQLHLAADDNVQLVISRSEGTWESMWSQHLPSCLLNIRPIAERQCCKERKMTI